MSNDYDTIANKIGDALAMLTGNTHEPIEGGLSNSVTITKDAWIATVVRLQRTRDWVEGLAESHRSYEADHEG